MFYKEFRGLQLSALGMGCMRLPVIDGDDKKIDQPTVEEMVDWAMANGINYYDTAWGYHGGTSETAMGKALAKHPRESFYLADKFPGYNLNNMDKVEEIFPEQLRKCGVDYFDFYLFHNVCDMNVDAYLDPKYGIMDYLKKQKAEGRIRFLGFSIHGDLECIKKFLDAYGNEMDFCQIQLNWLDYHFQKACDKLELLKEWNIPVWVMEPLRGGKLAKLEPAYEARLKEVRPKESVVGWAFRFLQSVDSVVVTLSGMSDFEQLKQNAATYGENKPTSDVENGILFDIAEKMTSKIAVPCTACRYCVDHCPQGLDIPHLLNLYNEHAFTGESGFIAPMALRAVDGDKQPSSCIGCGACEQVCPQKIKISEAMADFAEKLK